MAFQPIVDVETGKAFAYEALVRGPQGQPADTIIDTVTPDNLYAFDQQCRVAAIEGAVAAGILDTDAKLSINFLPNAVYSPLACIQLTLKTAAATGFPTDRLIFEFTENEEVADTGHVKAIVECYNAMGFGTAIDDFGAGHAGLSLLANLETDYLKLDMALIRDIEARPRSRMIVEGIVELANKLGVTTIVEGIETDAEWRTLHAMGLRYFQGFLFARPAFRSLPEFLLPSPRVDA
jgi:EAL domain-containing protein (putative c-di-GMP-specific phosphodiesterase class I)